MSHLVCAARGLERCVRIECVSATDQPSNAPGQAFEPGVNHQTALTLARLMQLMWEISRGRAMRMWMCRARGRVWKVR